MATATLLCKQCNFENEPERVYCHNCGAKLDRTILPPEATKREDPILVQERLRKLTNPKRGQSLRMVKSLFYSAAWAAVLAVIITMLLPPAGVPQLSRDAVENAPIITDDMDGAANSPVPRRLVYTQDQVNAFLGYSVRGKEADVAGIPFKFEHMFVHFEDGVVRIYLEESVFGYSLFANSAYTVTITGGKPVSKTVGGGFGRLRIPAVAMAKLDMLFARLWNALQRDVKLVGQMQSITFHKGQVEIISAGVRR